MNHYRKCVSILESEFHSLIYDIIKKILIIMSTKFSSSEVIACLDAYLSTERGEWPQNALYGKTVEIRKQPVGSPCVKCT